jgi:hypothetical protein
MSSRRKGCSIIIDKGLNLPPKKAIPMVSMKDDIY